MSSQLRSGPVSSRALSATQAMGAPVVGRRALAALTVSPARALSRLDLPTPVPPSQASTYADPSKPSLRRPSPQTPRAPDGSGLRAAAASAAPSMAARPAERGAARPAPLVHR